MELNKEDQEAVTFFRRSLTSSIFVPADFRVQVNEVLLSEDLYLLTLLPSGMILLKLNIPWTLNTYDTVTLGNFRLTWKVPVTVIGTNIFAFTSKEFGVTWTP